ncbi:hypothetical protein DMUE_5044 [Dictyocoela muelleri]|nr:hypothetical protein DMUE_5044 [Dictyocoela muelleri]
MNLKKSVSCYNKTMKNKTVEDNITENETKNKSIINNITENKKITPEIFAGFLTKIFPDIDNFEFPKIQKIDDFLMNEILKESEFYFKKNELISLNERIASCFVEDHDINGEGEGEGKNFTNNDDKDENKNEKYGNDKDLYELNLLNSLIKDNHENDNENEDNEHFNNELENDQLENDELENDELENEETINNESINDELENDELETNNSVINSNDSKIKLVDSNDETSINKKDYINEFTVKRKKTEAKEINIGSFKAIIDKNYFNDIVVYDICDDLEYSGSINTYESGYSLLKERINLLKKQNEINIERLNSIDISRLRLYASLCILNSINVSIQDFYLKKFKGRRKRRTKNNVDELVSMIKKRNEFKRLFRENLEFKFKDFKNLYLTENVKVDFDVEDYF